ncbi:MAG: hypothetical protein ACKPKO_27735, partial [Candidatus Fonsibacter sp.]
WDLDMPLTDTFRLRLNDMLTSRMHAWVSTETNDLWRGVGAVARHDFHTAHPAFLTLFHGQHVSLVGRPVWVWLDDNGTAGTYCVPATTYIDHPLPITYNTSQAPNDGEISPPPTPRSREMALMGLVPLDIFM